MPPKKSVFRQPGAKHFQLVHRSQRDPLIHDPDASQHVLKPFERGNVKKGSSRADLETLLSPSDLQDDQKRNVGEAALYGIYYDDTNYDYMQHLRTVGVQEDGVDSTLIEAPLLKKNQGKKKVDDAILPQEALPSGTELPRNYESQQAIPESIAGFKPDMDPHLRQVLEALEDDAFIDGDLSDNFFGELIEGGERTSDKEVDFRSDETGLESVEDGEVAQGDEIEGEGRVLSWEERFAQFRKNRSRTGQDATSDDGFASESGDTIGGLPVISVIGGKGKKRRKGDSDASGYSMSSSSMYRNEALQTLDERFDQIIEKEYREEEGVEVPSPSDEDESDEAPELITSREDFDMMVNEFLYDYEILGRKMKPKLEGNTATDKLETIRRALGREGRVQVIVNDDDDNDIQDLMTFEPASKDDKWDCETILTTYSNLENHPRIIRVSNSKPVPKIMLDPKTGFPLVNGISGLGTRRPVSNPANDVEEESHDIETGSTVYKRATISRPRNEPKEEKKERKATAKMEKQTRRAEKRATKEQFEVELKNQKRILANKAQQLKKL